MIVSVTITGLPPAAFVSSIILKTPNGAIFRSLPVNDTSNDPTRVLYTKFDVTPQVNVTIEIYWNILVSCILYF